ncbi:MAG: hypothetical protein FWH18_05675 [Marinilabiliaceae bacterium]|nr:hypothetical protein [Marinilabiliaceae bacterium]
MIKFELMSKITKLSLTFILLATIIITGCKSETERLNSLDDLNELSIGLKSGGAVLMEISYDITTSQWYEYDIAELTDIDIAHLNPSEEKQRIEMYLMFDGTVNMSIEEMDFERTIIIPHEIEPNDVPRITRTEIIGNNLYFYNSNRQMVGMQSAEMPRHNDLADRIMQMGDRFSSETLNDAFATMKGEIFNEAVDQMIAEADASGQLLQHDDNYATVRTILADEVHGAVGSAVMIIDMSIKKVVACVLYDEQDKGIFRTYYNYGDENSQILKATLTEQIIELPSGAKVWQITCSNYENVKYKLIN